MEFKALDIVLNKYAKYVVQQAKSNLTKDGKGGGALYNSIQYTLEKEANAFLLDFLMENYGPFVDEGVRGARPSMVKGGYQKAPMSKFKYTSKMPPMQMLADWAKSKNIRFRNEKGQYAKGSNRSMGFALQRSIYAQGLKPTYFFSKPFLHGLKKLPKDMFDAFVLDIESAIIFGQTK
mgnify:FL=1|tara:strand:+ start:653 stop:1186 length:534 start_codon:yes stop_codon:yes gene_type:complete